MNVDICRMKESLGEPEACPGDLCPFWEGSHCALDRVDFRDRPELAGFLLELRNELDSAKVAEDAGAARRHFFERLNAGHCD
jgi:hypothetical protein